MEIKILMKNKYNHYYKDISYLDGIDIYRVLMLYGVTDPCIAHAIKKLLCAGQRGGKDMEQDIQESIDALVRWQDMCSEDELV